jgi:predicted enzyme related to lactoylglutathione lyase/uncharacterized protein YndB with AHSA1/START domain
MSANGAPRAGSICFYDIVSTSVADTRRFYSEVFKWSFSEMGGYTLIQDGSPAGGAQLMGGIRAAQDFDKGGSVLTYIAVECVMTAIKAIEAAKGKLLTPPTKVPGYGTFVVFQAPGGPVQAVWEAEATAATGETIHEEVTFDAPAAKVYRALTDSAEFTKMTGAPATGSGDDGATFSAFGGQISGRQVELAKDKRVVQAWRAGNWPEGVYSMARFELRAEGKKTVLVFDHEGFPAGQKGRLAAGWREFYWTPMKKHLEGRG